MLDTELSGPWTSNMYAEHLPESIAFDEGLIKAALNFYQPEKVLDLGCGLGYFVNYFRQQGIEAWGVEPEDLGDAFKSPGHQIKQSLSQSFDLNEKYDLVVCLEVVEHIPRDFEEIVFDNIVRHMSKYLLFSGATVGQQGTGHINERSEQHWFSQLARRGLVLRHQASITIRSACTLSWYAKNVCIWELVHPASMDWADLVATRDSRILNREVDFHNQRRQTQTIIEQLQSQIHQTGTELDEKQNQLQQTQTIIEQLQSQIHQTGIDLDEKQNQLQQTQTIIEQLRSQVHQVNEALQKSQAQLTAYQASRFWQLHQLWLTTEQAWKRVSNRYLHKLRNQDKNTH